MKTIEITGVIGDEFDGVTAQQVTEQLADHSGELVVNINSVGGYLSDGVAIFNAIKQHSPIVNVVGLAASAASLIAMAGKEIHMLAGSRMMIHKAWGVTIGDEAEHNRAATQLRSGDRAAVEVYQRHSKLSADDIMGLMSDETWMSGEEAVELGFATHTESKQAANVDAPEDAVNKLKADILARESAKAIERQQGISQGQMKLRKQALKTRANHANFSSPTK